MLNAKMNTTKHAKFAELETPYISCSVCSVPFHRYGSVVSIVCWGA